MSKTTQRRHKSKPTPPMAKNRWLLPSVLVGAALLIGGVLLLVRGGQQPTYEPLVKGSPRLEVDQEEVDYGNVRFETPVETVFRVSNVGDQPLYILDEPEIELVEGC